MVVLTSYGATDLFQLLKRLPDDGKYGVPKHVVGLLMSNMYIF